MALPGAPIPSQPHAVTRSFCSTQDAPKTPHLGVVEEKHLCTLSGSVYTDIIMPVAIFDFLRLRATPFCCLKLRPQAVKPPAARPPVSSHP
ncbi:hypothetical protein NDU88_003489 [Pleurodeles waltl]|uniref:Uncharacterized protein n=1 Tax=Pleurodeles waltl TaxID=8319 RepID=A0AAV7M5A5_PLEWA|nr:hypothetical protein NDU88_003489 [Pleurodeles waltl]